MTGIWKPATLCLQLSLLAPNIKRSNTASISKSLLHPAIADVIDADFWLMLEVGSNIYVYAFAAQYSASNCDVYVGRA